MCSVIFCNFVGLVGEKRYGECDQDGCSSRNEVNTTKLYDILVPKK